MHIIADDQIPGVTDWFGPYGTLKQKPGNRITAEDVATADILLVRTITTVNAALLAGSTVQFVGTMTAGTDHLDIPWLNANNIAWTAAPGANAPAVAQYVIATVAALRQQQKLPRTSFRAAIIGVGAVGRAVASALTTIGADILLNDPPRAEAETQFASASLSDCTTADLVCLHTPLTRTGPHPTWHLIGSDFLSNMRSNATLLSAGRGAVVDHQALRQATHLTTCLDVWEHEPHIDLHCLQHATIATPHIAGYSQAAKWRATAQVYQAIARHFGWTTHNGPPHHTAPAKTVLSCNCDWETAVLTTYDPRIDSTHMKRTLLATQDVGVAFEKLRREYVWRAE